MYLRSEKDTIYITNFDDVILRILKQIIILTNGNQLEDKISFKFEEKAFINLINFLEKNNIEFTLDYNLTDFYNFHVKNVKKFEIHKSNALEIKNNLNGSSKEYVKFTRIINDKLTRKLYEHQLKAAYHMAYSLNSCNFSVPGSGKTTIVYAAYAYLKDLKIVDKLLIIAPLSASLAWKNEYFDCFGKKPRFINLNELDASSKDEYFKKQKDMQSEITFMNYEGFNRIKKSMDEFFRKNKVMVVLDEAHKIKNPNAKRSINIMKFADKAVSRIVLTGTPIPNGYVDLYNLFEFIWPGKKITGFNLNQLKKITESNKKENDVSLLMNNIDPFYIRISKDVLGLPKPKFNDPIIVEMGKYQQLIYDYIADDFIKQNFDGIDYNLQLELKKAKLIRLMQSLTNPSSLCKSLNNTEFIESKMYDIICKYESIETPVKYKTVLDLVKRIIFDDEKVIIWTQYTHNLLGLKRFLSDNNIYSELLYGDIENSERENIITRFHIEKDFRVIIANPAAVAESISLHKVCHNAIYVDLSFNSSHYMQSKDRIHRVGLPKDTIVNYYFILCNNSIDHLIYNRVLEKEKIMLDVIEGNFVPLFSKDFDSDLSEDDLEYISNYLRKERKL